MTLNVTVAIGQIFIFLSNELFSPLFSPVVTTKITTTRKFFSIVLPVMVYHGLSTCLFGDTADRSRPSLSWTATGHSGTTTGPTTTITNKKKNCNNYHSNNNTYQKHYKRLTTRSLHLVLQNPDNVLHDVLSKQTLVTSSSNVTSSATSSNHLLSKTYLWVRRHLPRVPTAHH